MAARWSNIAASSDMRLRLERTSAFLKLFLTAARQRERIDEGAAYVVNLYAACILRLSGASTTATSLIPRRRNYNDVPRMAIPMRSSASYLAKATAVTGKIPTIVMPRYEVVSRRPLLNRSQRRRGRNYRFKAAVFRTRSRPS